MKNVEINIDKTELVIKVDLTKTFGKSKSGKTTIIASTNGNIVLPYKDEIKLGLNLYKPE